MGKKNGFAPVIILIVLMIAGIVGYFLYRDNQNKNNVSQNYVQGEVIVSFNEGVTYKQARDLFDKIGITNFENGYWKSVNKKPTDKTVLSNLDLFEVRVASGTEDVFIERLVKESIVRAASKNYIGHTD